MKRNGELLLRTIDLFVLIIFYYIALGHNIYLYVLSISMFHIFKTCLGINISDSFKKNKSDKNKLNLFKICLLSIAVITIINTLLSVCISDLLTILFHINDTLIIFLLMGLSLMAEPVLKTYCYYLESRKAKILSEKVLFIYNILDKIFFLLIAILVFRVFNLSISLAISLLYLSKIISSLLLIVIIYLITSNNKIINNQLSSKINYKLELKNIYLADKYEKLVKIVRYSYYYLSIVILYYILNSKYALKVDIIDEAITFIYLYAYQIIDYLIYIVKMINKELPSNMSVPSRIYQNLKLMLPVTIILAIISPLICKLIFNNASYSIYFAMTVFLSIIILLYDITFDNIKNKKIIMISLFSGILAKIILVLPLINSFYRMGYNLIYGDILSTILGMFLSVSINYIYIRYITKAEEKYFPKLLDILYSNIILSIVLILLEFIIPIDTKDYIKTFGILLIYLFISVLVIKLKNKKRG